MHLEKLKAHKAHDRWLEGVFSQNPVFIRGLALPFAVMITSNLKNSVAVSILLACSMIPCILLTALIRQRLPKWTMLTLCALLSMILIMTSLPLVMPIAPEIADSLGIYVPILALNSILSFLCLRHRKQTRFILVLADAIGYSIGFALALCLISSLREIGGANTIWGIPLALPIKMSGLQVAFAGFIVTAFLCALFQSIGRFLRGYILRQSNALPEKEAQL